MATNRQLAEMSDEDFERKIHCLDTNPKFKATIIALRKQQIKDLKEKLNENNLPLNHK